MSTEHWDTAAPPPGDAASPAQPRPAHAPSAASGPPPPPAALLPGEGQAPPSWPPAQQGHPLPPPGGEQQAGRRRFRRSTLAAAFLAAVLAGGSAGGAVGFWAAEGSGRVASLPVAAADTSARSGGASGTVAAVASKALPSVVSIGAASHKSGEEGTGTGFVFDREGHILTNSHVVGSSGKDSSVSVTLSSGTETEAEVVGRAQGYDVAVLKLKNAPPGLLPLPLGNSDTVAVGDTAVAIGSPFGLSQTVTAGIISAKNRPVAPNSGEGHTSYMNALQTDASINPGNSGGPLLDSHGTVIGINSAIESPGSLLGQAGSVGLGFAIPVNQAKTVAEQLIKTGEPVYPVIGATVDTSDKGQGGAVIAAGKDGTQAVTPEGPAAAAGLKAGDVITRLGSQAVSSGPSLISAIWTHQPGDTVPLTYERDGRESTVQVTLGERKGDSR